ncbi:hypothetical protein DPMN_109099 [Dreissena polymorpha]|uniref:DDE-1 domain-containing protein n=1 Tax=Dreissena polymorpha TaxID=45954 RepID=A0A9D4QLN4_DREPO|nr:hypothetical protein DPMN_109099 [Dreissena polymorpha]
MNPDLLKRKTPGADAAMSDSRWSNLDVFTRYLTEHFIICVPSRETHPLILRLVGHRSHVSLTLSEWAKKQNILCIMPAHTSHLCQPLEVVCFGHFQKMYNAQGHRETSAAITRYNICDIS